MQEKLLSTLQRFWRGFLAFTPGQKVVTVALGLAVVIGGFAFSSWASKPSYAPLFTNLAPADASGIIDKLNANKTPYQLAANGTSILVPQKDVYDLRLTMSAEGLPSAGTSGYSLLDKEGITTSEFKQHMDYQRALEGELSKTIKSIRGVREAAVHLAMPQQSVFTDDTQKATGSVLLTTDPGATLSSGQVQSVVNLVSSSVPGLAADQVSVSDASGKVLSAAGDANSGAAADTRTEAIAQYNKRTAAEVQQMLDQLVGTGHAVVTVNADLDFDKNNTVSHRYVYATGIPPLSEANTTETYGAGQNGAGGVLGAASPSPSAVPGASSANGYRKTTTTRDNAVGEETETRSAAPGTPRKLSVAVLLDKNAPPVDEAQVRQLVSSAVGLDAKRGDTLALASAPFDTSAATAAQKAASAAAAEAASARQHAELMSLVKTVLVVLLVLVVIVATLIANKRRRRPGPADDLDLFLSTLNDSPGSLPPAPRDIVPPQSREAAINLARQRDLAVMADSQPQEVARLLRTWLNTKES
ncbi:MAG: flagellar basal-body MS-ring/collar protein FliF [Jatrophihabitantaceae bacterium]